MLGWELIAALVLQYGSSEPTGRYEIGQRLQVVDSLWLEADDEAKLRASSHLTRIPAEWSGQPIASESPLPNWRTVAKSLDFAVAALLGAEDVSPYQALSFRAAPFFVDSDRPLIDVSWVYRPLKTTSVTLFVDPNRLVAVSVDEAPSFRTKLPSGLQNSLREAGLELMDLEISIVPPEEGAIDYAAPVLFGEGGEERVKELADHSDKEAAALAEYVLDYARGSRMFNTAFVPLLKQAESLAEGASDEQEMVFASAEGFAGFFPSGAAESSVLLVLRADDWLPPQFFLVAAGDGMALDLARERGWPVVVAPAERTLAQAVAWGQTRAGEKEQVLLVTLGAGSEGVSASEVAATALLAPVRFHAELADDPDRLFLGFGELHAPLLSGVKEAYEELGLPLNTYPNCSYLMLPAEAWPDVFAFFDSVVGGD